MVLVWNGTVKKYRNLCYSSVPDARLRGRDDNSLLSKSCDPPEGKTVADNLSLQGKAVHLFFIQTPKRKIPAVEPHVFLYRTAGYFS
ncbi:MAG: hypothetical protein LBC19_09345 [Tannerella sp.]|nr:hypothetical protein [Tannerella sp.]